MKQDSKNILKNKRLMDIGPCGEYNCPICIFTKSQAPGNPYDVSKCPKYNSGKVHPKKEA